MRTGIYVAILASVMCCSSTSAQQTLNAIDQGWYDEFGTHDSGNENYFVGFDNEFSGLVHRNFSAFDLSQLDQPIMTATLMLFNLDGTMGSGDGFSSDDPFETYSLFEFTSDIDQLLNGSGGISAFNELGSGLGFGSYDISVKDNGTFVEVTLNADAIQAINNIAFQDSGDQRIVFGGAITTLDFKNNEYAFAFSHEMPDVRLVVTSVPEPSSTLAIWILFGSQFRRRRK